jgi:hypothetical protein
MVAPGVFAVLGVVFADLDLRIACTCGFSLHVVNSLDGSVLRGSPLIFAHMPWERPLRTTTIGHGESSWFSVRECAEIAMPQGSATLALHRCVLTWAVHLVECASNKLLCTSSFKLWCTLLLSLFSTLRFLRISALRLLPISTLRLLEISTLRFLHSSTLRFLHTFSLRFLQISTLRFPWICIFCFS